MLKSAGNFLHRTPWWGVAFGGLLVLACLVLFAAPVQVIRLHDSGTTPQEKRAIEREINLAFGDTALNFAEDMVRAIRDRASDPDRRRELDQALAEIARAKQELSAAQSGGQAVREMANESADAAMAAATDAAQVALEAAVQARRAVEEARDDAVALLKDRRLDFTATERSFDTMLKNAADNEKSAREALQSIRSLHKQPQAAAAASAASQSTPVEQPALPEGRRLEIRTQVDRGMWRVGVGSALILVFIPLFVVLLIAKYFLGRSRRAQAVAEEKTQEAALSHMSRQLTEARLQALQAQVEPHFLYNTLANVQALTEVDAAAAHTMVGHLIDYLRASLPKMRETTSTVGQELDRVRAYLALLQMRLGPRLAFSIDADEYVRTLPCPPMMLPTLVENAVKHGLEPVREGGRIDVRVWREATMLHLEVRDTGRGLSDAPVQVGSGVGLGNLRERLATMYGAQARCTIRSNTPQGVVAALVLPLEPMPVTGGADLAYGAAARDPERVSGWSSTVRFTRLSHSMWSRLVWRFALLLLVLLCAGFMVALVGLYTGWMPVQVGDLHLDGLEGMALGSVGLLAAFAVVALVILLVVAVLYGLGFLFAALLACIALAILLSLFPVVSPFVLGGLLVYWWLRRRDARMISGRQ